MAYPHIPEGSHPKARWILCEKTQEPIFYPGFGRPPRLHPSIRKDETAARRRAAYAAKNAGKPKRKRGRPSKRAQAA